ncbi:MAG: hypothetical protein LBC62_10655 [Treponema sp.]|nr:hypothetical protein [Treponema sp.]
MAADQGFFRKIFPLFISRGVFFFLLMCLLTVFLYSIGTVQGFMDSTQMMLLRMAGTLGFFLAAGSVYSLVMEFVLVFWENRRQGPASGFRDGSSRGAKALRTVKALGWGILYLIMGAFGAVTALGALFIVTVSQGNAL